MYKIDHDFKWAVSQYTWQQDSKGYWKRSGGKGPQSLHRFVWWLAHGSCPAQLDHINRDPSDNRLENLRPATPTLQSLNVRRNKQYIEPKHLTRGGTPRWRVRVGYRGKKIHVGTFRSEAEAQASREACVARLIEVEASIAFKGPSFAPAAISAS
jgi:hypothetical protein